MANIQILGANGMLGHVLVEHLRACGHTVVGLERKDFDPFRHSIRPLMEPAQLEWDYIINCIAIIRQRGKWGNGRLRGGWGKYQSVNPSDHFEALTLSGFECDWGPTDDLLYQFSMINAVFPWRLAAECKRRGVKLIHISTPAVFDTKSTETYQAGRFAEFDQTVNTHEHDVYGVTKAWGEPNDCMVLRLSAVGHEKPEAKKLALLEWFKSQEGNENVWGYRNHWWNGMTTGQAARCIHTIIEKNLYVEDQRHIFSPQSTTKYYTLCMIRDHLKLNITVKPMDHRDTIVETLDTKYDLNSKLEIPDFLEQIQRDL